MDSWRPGSGRGPPAEGQALKRPKLEAGVQPKSALKSALKREEGGREVRAVKVEEPSAAAAPAPERKSVQFKTHAEISEEGVLAAMTKVAKHIGEPAKFGKASKLALQLLEGGSVTSPQTRDAFFAILAVAMAEPRRATDKDLREGYKSLFLAVYERRDLFNKKQEEKITRWWLWAVLANELQTDDNFEFSRTAARVKQEVEALPAATEEEDALAAAELPSTSAPATSAPATSAPATSAPSGSPGATSANPGGGSEKVKVKAEPGEEEGGEEEDPFGLGVFMKSKKEKRERKERARRAEAEARERERERVAAEAAAALAERRAALLHCLTTAAGYYKFSWAQTAIDTLARHAFDHRDRFTAPQRAAVEALWGSVREQQSRRKQGRSIAGGGGKLDLTPFERLSAHYAGEHISIRKAVGGSGGRAEVAWLG